MAQKMHAFLLANAASAACGSIPGPGYYRSKSSGISARCQNLTAAAAPPAPANGRTIPQRTRSLARASLDVLLTHPHVDSIAIPGLRFDELSAQRSWRAMLDLFDEPLQRPRSAAAWSASRLPPGGPSTRSGRVRAPAPRDEPTRWHRWMPRSWSVSITSATWDRTHSRVDQHDRDAVVTHNTG